MRVTGVPKGGKRVQLFEGLTVQLPGGAVYYTDDEDQFCISMPTVPARAGMTELADGTETRWSISQLTEYAAINFDTDGTVELSDYHNVARDGMEAAAKGMAEKMSELFGFAHYEARFGAADENRIVAYTCANSNFLGDRYLPGYFLIGIPHYPEKVTLYMGYYDAMDGPVFEKEFLPLLNSAQAGGQAEKAAVQDDGGLGPFAGDNGKLDAMKALSLFQNDVIFFNEGEIHWDGKRHTIAGIQFNAEKVDENRALMKRAQAVIEGLGDLASYLEDNPKLRVPASRLHSRMREFLHGEDVTGMMFFHLSAWHQFWLMAPDQVGADADGKDVVMLDVNFPKAVPGCRELIGELLRTLRAYNGVTEDREIVFSNVRNLDGTEPFDGDLLEYETEPEPSKPAHSTASSAAKKSGATSAKSVAAPSKPATPAPQKADSAVEALRAKALAAIDSCTAPEHRANVRRIIGEVLTGELMTWFDIREHLGIDINAVQTVYALLKNPYVQTDKVIQTSGISAGTELTAFCLGEKNDPRPAGSKSAAAAPAKTTMSASSQRAAVPNETLARAKEIEGVLSATPMTAAEINAALGTDYTALQIANGCKLISGVSTTKVIRKSTNAKGLSVDREYAAYCFDGSSAAPSSSAKPAAPSKPAPAPKQENGQPNYYKAVKAMKAAVQEAIDQTKQEVADQKAEVERLRQKKTAAEQKLKGLGFFQFSEKAAAKEEIAQCAKALAGAEQKLGSIKMERMRKVKQVLDQNPIPMPPAPSRASRSKSRMKGASAEIAEKARNIESVLSMTPMTAAEINAALGMDYTALQIANACKFISAGTTKVFRIETDNQGEPVLKEYSAYYLV